MSTQDPFRQPVDASGGSGGNPYVAGPNPMGPPPPSGKTGWVIAAVGCAVMVPMLGICAGLLIPAVSAAREAARRMSCSNNIKQIGLAMHNYHQAFGSLPPAYTVDANGKRLHSWRTLLLPYMDQQSLYEQIDLSKPWDDPANITFTQVSTGFYECPSAQLEPGYTTYVAVIDQGGMMSGRTPVTFRQVTDGLGNTLMIAEADSASAVPWMSPQDMAASDFIDQSATGGHPGGGHVLLGDGSVQFVTENVSEDERRDWISIGSTNGVDGSIDTTTGDDGVYVHPQTGARFQKPDPNWVLSIGSAAQQVNPLANAVFTLNDGQIEGERVGVLIIESLGEAGERDGIDMGDVATQLANQMPLDDKTLESVQKTVIADQPGARYVVSGGVDGIGQMRYLGSVFVRDNHLFQVVAFGRADQCPGDDPGFIAIHDALRFP